MAHTSARHPRRRRLLLVASIAAAMALVAGLLDAAGVVGGWGRAPAASAGNPVAVRPVKGRKVAVPAMRPWSRPHTSWPAAQTATALIAAGAPAAHRLQAGLSAGSGRAGTLPVWIGAPDTAAAKGTATTAVVSPPAVTRVRVDMTSRAAADALGVHGVVFSLGPLGRQRGRGAGSRQPRLLVLRAGRRRGLRVPAAPGRTAGLRADHAAARTVPEADPGPFGGQRTHRPAGRRREPAGSGRVDGKPRRRRGGDAGVVGIPGAAGARRGQRARPGRAGTSRWSRCRRPMRG